MKFLSVILNTFFTAVLLGSVHAWDAEQDEELYVKLLLQRYEPSESNGRVLQSSELPKSLKSAKAPKSTKSPFRFRELQSSKLPKSLKSAKSAKLTSSFPFRKLQSNNLYRSQVDEGTKIDQDTQDYLDILYRRQDVSEKGADMDEY